MRTLAFAMVVPALALCLLGSASAQVLGPGDASRSIDVGGMTRTYLVHVPPSYTGATPVPLVVDYHGLSSTAAVQAAISGFKTLSDSAGFIVVHPQGVSNAWNGGICCSNAADDVAFTRALVAKMETEAAIDARRVYATGLSNGGAMTQRLACEAADLFAAAAPMAFPISVSPTTSCVPSRPIPVLTFMGLTDTIVPYGGGTFPSAATTFTHWRTTDQCGADAPEVHNASGASYCDADLSCAAGVQVGLCSITSTSGPPYAGHILYINPDFNLSVVAWSFLSQFALPPPIPALPGAWPAILGGLLAVASGLRHRRGVTRHDRVRPHAGARARRTRRAPATAERERGADPRSHRGDRARELPRAPVGRGLAR
jgi:polyhydroxybutyrate depolymerase